MNKKAKHLGMYQTSFVNPHGLANALNYSTAKDMLSLSTFSFSHKLFMDISSTESYLAFMYEDIG
jgi:D-alanyl-D-alanine carboxypeptidase (penicillin-binding protein 5/6)